MNDVLQQTAVKLKKDRRRRKGWQKIVRTLAILVVFCTTYALILPAITMERKKVCGMEEHTHTIECYLIPKETDGAVLDGTEAETRIQETDENSETEGGPAESEIVQETMLSESPLCGQEEHTHDETCYEQEQEAVQPPPGYLCFTGEHQHNAECIDQNGALFCTIPEHIHEVACIVEGLDLNADVENEEIWMQMADSVNRTGNWSEDISALARMQVGYKESEKNVILTEAKTLKGYTRYGAWYGDPYGDWNTMFVSYCLNYAGVAQEVLPRYADGNLLFGDLQNTGLIESCADGIPETGDLLFINTADESIRTAIVTAADSAAGLAEIAEGDVDNQVVIRSLSMADASVLGFFSIKKAQLRYEVLKAPSPEGEQEAEMESESETESETEGESETEAENETETEAETGAENETETEAVTETETEEKKQFTAETNHYIVTVSCSVDMEIQEGVCLQVSEYEKDSDIYRQRCEEAGYELEWLLNIGFYLEDEEISLDGVFEVTVRSKDGNLSGCDITHFAEDGTQRIDGSNTDNEGQGAITFSSEGFSDFGGGVVKAAEMAAVELKFTSYSEWNAISFPEGNYYSCPVGSVITIVLGDATATYTEPQISVTGGELLSSTYSCEDPYCARTGWCGHSPRHTFVIKVTSPAVFVTGSVMGSNWPNNQVTIDSSGLSGGNSGENPGGDDNEQEPDPAVPEYPHYPHAVHTGTVNISRLRFYNICENGNDVSALAGCVFEIQGNNGYTATIVSGNDPEVNLPSDIPDGSYTITEVSVPAGYMRDTEFERHFSVLNGTLVSDDNIGTFINHSLEQLTAGKTAEVEDYNNRIYQVLLSARSHMRMYQMDPVDMLFVVDQSNSMLFPAGLEATGKSVTLKLYGENNVSNLEALNLDKSQMYYIISDPTGTSTVWCLWYNGEAWLYQDASYYAKAKHENKAGYQDPNETAVFPENKSYTDQKNSEASGTRSNGGGIGYSLLGSGLGKDIDAAWNDTRTYQIYTSTSEFNRLHYLEEALTNMIYMLSDMNTENRVTLTRFTKTIDEENDCIGPLELTPDNADLLVSKVRSINTSGGTRQDIALKHVYEQHLNVDSQGYRDDPRFNYTILITDGAPVLSGGSEITSLGGPNDAASTTANSVYAQIKGYAELVRQKSSLMTVGLGMDNVEAGKDVLNQIASSDSFYCALNDASELVESMQRLMFEGFRPKGAVDITGEVTDEISDSFYPIAWTDPGAGTAAGRRVLRQSSDKDWILLTAGDWITLEGKYTTAGAADAAGQLLQKEDRTFYVLWRNVHIADPYVDQIDRIAWVNAGQGGSTGRIVIASDGNRDWILLNEGDWITQEGQYFAGTPNYWEQQYYGSIVSDGSALAVNWGWSASAANRQYYSADHGWNGTFYVKAKEDFIGGNAIYTNKDAAIRVHDSDKHFESPSVNVRLLDMNEMSSEVTVYLGDVINEDGNSPIDSLRYFYENTRFSKLIADSGNVLNKVNADDVLGLYDDTFALRYPIGRDLTQEEWNTLMSGQSVSLPYFYDNASNHGPVGIFTFSLEKSGMTGAEPDYTVHEAKAACQPEGVPSSEECQVPAETYILHVVYNAYRLGENGRPAVNIHNGTGSPGTEVGTGATLETGAGILDKKNVHEVHVISGVIEIFKRFTDGIISEQDHTFTFVLHRAEDGEDTAGDIIQSITIPANTSQASESIRFENLRRGTYTVKEAADEFYMTESIAVLDGTNCSSTPPIGEKAKEVIFVMGDNITGENVIGRNDSMERYTSYIDPVNGVYGKAEFVNTVIVFKAEIPVTKVWGDGAENHKKDEVYLVLYLDNELFVDSQENAKILRLDSSTDWKGSFEVVLLDKEDDVTNYDYSVREVTKVSKTSKQDWLSAVLENDKVTQLYFEKVLNAGAVTGINGNGYMVQYKNSKDDGWIVENNQTIELPKTGGSGTWPYTIGGVMLLLLGGFYYCILGHRQKKGGA